MYIVKNAKKNILTLFKTGFFHVFGSNTINRMLIFLSSIVIIRIIPKAEFGIYSYSFNIMSLFMLISGIGLTSGVMQLCSENMKNKEKSNDIYSYGSAIGLRVNFFIGIIILAFSFCFPLPIKGANYLLGLYSLYPFLFIINEFQQVRLRSSLENIKFSYINTISGVMIFVFSIIGGIIIGAQGLIIGQYTALVSSALIAFFFFGVPVSFAAKKINREIKTLLFKISLISMVNNGLSQSLFLIDIFIIGFIIPSEIVVASYRTATVIPIGLNFISSAVCMYAYPYFAKNKDDKKWVREKYKQLLSGMFVFNLFVSIFIFVFAPQIIEIIFGKIYLDALMPFRILSISYFFAGTFKIISGNLLVTQRKLKFNLIVAILSAVINIIGNIVLIQLFGVNGSAATTLIVVVFAGVLSTLYWHRVIK